MIITLLAVVAVLLVAVGLLLLSLIGAVGLLRTDLHELLDFQRQKAVTDAGQTAKLLQGFVHEATRFASSASEAMEFVQAQTRLFVASVSSRTH